MSIYVYVKNTEDISAFESVIDLIGGNEAELTIFTESRRSFRELEKIKDRITNTDVLMIYDASSLGLNEADIANQLEWFIEKSICLVICNIETTYSFGTTQPMNKAILTTILHSLLNNNKNIVKLPANRRKNSGRNKIAYPDNWEELYDAWVDKKISSKEFIEKTGLKKATFYNLVTDYRTTLKELEDFQNQYKLL